MTHPTILAVWAQNRAGYLPRRDPEPALTWCTHITLPGGTRKGTRYDPSSHPGQLTFLRRYTAARAGATVYREFVVVGPTQDGKTVTVILVPLLHHLIEVGDNAVYGLPDELAGLRQWTEKVEPAMRLSGFDSSMPRAGVGSRGGATRVTIMQFGTGGLLTWMGGGGKNESAQSSVSAPLVVEDEVDSMKPGTLERIDRRGDAYGLRAIRIRTSTIKKDDGSSKILALLRDSTDSRLWYPCHACNRYQPLVWEQVHVEDGDELTAFETARYRCPHCEVLWTDDDRRMALRRAREVMRGQSIDAAGVLVGDEPRTLVWGELWTALDSPFRHLGQLAVWYRRAQGAAARGDHEPMRQFYRDQLCREYVGDRADGDETPAILTRAHLVARSEDSTFAQVRSKKDEDGDSLHLAECPDEVAWMVAACDVQRGGARAPGRLYFTLHGFAADFRSYDLAWGSVICAPPGQEPSTGEMHDGLDRLTALLRSLSQEIGRPLVRRGVDVGDRQDELRLWLIRHPDWLAVKGATGRMKADSKESDGFDIADWIYRRQQDSRSTRPWWLHFIDVDEVRWQAQSAFLLPVGQPGAAHVPSGLNAADSLVRHYCGTAPLPDGRGGRRWSDRADDRMRGHPEWQRRVDLLDCRTYALGLAYQYARTLNRPTRRVQYGVIGNLGA